MRSHPPTSNTTLVMYATVDFNRLNRVADSSNVIVVWGLHLNMIERALALVIIDIAERVRRIK